MQTGNLPITEDTFLMHVLKVFSSVSRFVMCISGVMLYQCTSTPNSAEPVNYHNDRRDVTHDLITLRNDIDRDIEKVEKSKLSSNDKHRRERAVNTLIKKKNQVEEMLARVNNSTPDDWSTISKNARATLSDVRRVCQKLEKIEFAEND